MPPLQGESTHGVVVETQMSALKARLLMTAVTAMSAKLAAMGVDVAADAVVSLWFPTLPAVAIEASVS